ncbi:SDR family oxidoreductase [Frigoriflavimonas asaccharolytica]|uniref:3-oxoacyl-[acyl-carrier protein] reductase n=1 Tax=Frigoriflavimonas asaccharolytica TaxID=2735899 RepID=A0A8J8G5Q0_9FLAO|nr:SDR family oxidoreductase [Frigoriflavimonas asaccharolytica]NRS91220.1 3-oxoacyl-[acyl-carrier protein] reductase [Frigoriflavimonas asaccharolytica]
MQKVILITGASRGIGKEIALQFGGKGNNIIVNYANSEESALETVSEIEKAGGKAIAIKADVSKKAEVTAMFDVAISHYGKIDVLINNAGVMVTKPLKDLTEADYTKMFDINVKGTFNTLQECFSKLADNGFIINLSSSTTKMMLPTYTLYSATKAAVEQMTRIYAKEIGRGISINAIAPGPTSTELFFNGKSEEQIEFLTNQNTFKRLGEPSDIAKVAQFLASDESKWISGQVIPVNGGMV